MPEIDAQHRQLLELINSLGEQAAIGAEGETVDELLVELSTYIVEHFGREEELMRQVEYPQLEAHRAQHVRFVRRVIALQREWRLAPADQGSGLLADFLAFLMHWFIGHVLSSDQEYVPHFERAGLVLRAQDAAG